jgi:hypothetical protein
MWRSDDERMSGRPSLAAGSARKPDEVRTDSRATIEKDQGQLDGQSEG